MRFSVFLILPNGFSSSVEHNHRPNGCVCLVKLRVGFYLIRRNGCFQLVANFTVIYNRIVCERARVRANDMLPFTLRNWKLFLTRDFSQFFLTHLFSHSLWIFGIIVFVKCELPIGSLRAPCSLVLILCVFFLIDFSFFFTFVINISNC